MFDYQAGEKFKLTLIMVGFAGLMAGMFFAFLMMPAPEMSNARRARMIPRHAHNSDITGIPAGMSAPPQQPVVSPADIVDRFQAKTFIDQFIRLAWDLSAGSARQSQAQAIACMTPECAQAYQTNIWTPDLAKQIEEAGLQSSFTPRVVDVSQNLNDGAVVVKVQGAQTLGVAGNAKAREVNLEYLIRNTPQGMRIAGISEGGQAVQ